MKRLTARRVALAVAALGVVAAGITAALISFRTSRGEVDQHAQLTGDHAAGPESSQTQPAQVGEAKTDRDSGPPVTAATESRPEPSPFTRYLVATLTNLDFTQGPITEDQADKWKHTLQTLTEQGSAAVPAIREFLGQNQELDFTTNPGGNLLGQSSLRSAMINALSQIGGPEATSLMVDTLNTTTLPSEIGQLTQAIEEQAPGQYRHETFKAITDVLNMAANGQLPADWDVGSLFKLVQVYGDSTTASAIDQFEGPFRYYATMALAGMESGDGIPELIREAKTSEDGAKRDFAVQMLAQVAAQHPNAGAALVDQANANEISDAAWRKIAIALAVDRYEIGQPSDQSSGPGSSAAAAPGLKTFHIASGNQNFYSLPLLPDAQLDERLALIKQLLGATTSNPAAQAALRAAQSSLTQVASN
jgi:hypothetical protein